MSLSTGQKVLFYLILTISAILIFAPAVIAFIMSFMTNQEIFSGNLLPRAIHFENYLEVFNRFPLMNYLLNSFIVSISITIGQLIVASLAAYAFTFIQFKGREVIFFIFLATLMIPFEASIIPNFQTIRNLGLLDTYTGLTLPYFATAFGTFLLRQNFKQIPIELKEASEIAGIGDFRFYLTVVLPMARTSLVTLGVYAFLTSWNMYLWPLLTKTKETVRTVQIGLRQLQSQEQVNEWGIIMAGAIIVVLPTLILLFLGQKRLQRGLAEGAIK